MSNKITFVTGSMGRGGAERVISLLSNYYAEKGWDVEIVMLLHSYIGYELNDKVKVFDCSYSGGIKKGFLQTILKLRKYFNNTEPNIIVCFMAQNCLLTGLALLGLKRNIIMSERIDPYKVKRNFLYRKLLDYFYLHANKVIFQTKRASSYFSQAIQDNSCIIGNPITVNCDKQDIQNTKKHRIVTAGRMTEQKNQAMLIKAFAEVRKCYPEYTLTIYGEGVLRKKLELLCETLELNEVIDLPGNVPDLHQQIRNAEIFVLPSNFEGFSNALLEAMMMGLPVIATNCAGCDEVIKTGKNGILIDVGDTNALIESLKHLIANKEYRLQLAEAGKMSVQQFKTENIIYKWDQLIIDCVSKK